LASEEHCTPLPTSGARKKFCDAIVDGGALAKNGKPSTGTLAWSETHSDSREIGCENASGLSNSAYSWAQVGSGTGAIGVKNALRLRNASV
jgi:hypothetical protein